MPRPYEDPTMEYVTAMTQRGITNPNIVVMGKSWTDDEKRSFVTKFNSLLPEVQKADEKKRAEAKRMGLAAHTVQESTPILRDIEQGFRQGVSGIASLLRRPFDPEEADAIIRQSQFQEQAHSVADLYGSIGETLPRGIRGAARSITEMTPGALVAGPYGAIAVTSTSVANRAITEGKDAGLTGGDLFAYVGTQGALEALFAATFQRFGMGGLESLMGRGITRSGVKGMFKEGGKALFHESLEELPTEFAQALNEKFHGVDPTEWSMDQAKRIFIDTMVQTTLATGAISGVSSAVNQQALKEREEFAGGLAEQFGIDQESALRMLDRASKRKGDFMEAIGEEMLEERLLTTEGLAEWVQESPENQAAAQELAQHKSPSRSQWAKAGLPKRGKGDRARIAGELRGLIKVTPEPAVTPEEVAPEPKEVPQEPEVAPVVPEEVIPEEVPPEAGEALPVEPAPPVKPEEEVLPLEPERGVPREPPAPRVEPRVEEPAPEIEVEQPVEPEVEPAPALEPEEVVTVDQIDQAVNDRARGALFIQKGKQHVPGLRLADQEEAGRIAYLVEKGEATSKEWEKWIESAKSENRFSDKSAAIQAPVPPQARLEPEPKPEPEAEKKVEEPKLEKKPKIKGKKVVKAKPAKKKEKAGLPEGRVRDAEVTAEEGKAREPVPEGEVTETEKEKEKRLTAEGAGKLAPFDISVYKGLEDMTIMVVPGQEAEMTKRVTKMVRGLKAGRKPPKPRTPSPRAIIPRISLAQFKDVKDRIKLALKLAPMEDVPFSEVFLKEGNGLVVTNGHYLHVFNIEGLETKLEDGVYDENSKPTEVEYPDYKKTASKLPAYKGEDAALNLVTNLRASATIFSDKHEHKQVAVLVNPDKTIGFTASDKAGNYSEVHLQEGAKLIGYYDADLLNDLLSLQAKTGKAVKVYAGKIQKVESLVLENENGDRSVLASIRVSEEGKAKIEEIAIKKTDYKKEEVKPKGGPGQEASPYSFDMPEAVTDYDENSNRENPMIFSMADMLEVLRVAEASLPKIFPKLRGGRGVVQGKFWAQLAGTIGLRADIFIGPVIESGVVKADQAEEAKIERVEKIIEKNPGLKEEDIHIKEEPESSGKIRLTFYKIDPDFARRVLSHEIGHWADYMSEKEMGRGGILGRLAKLKKYLKTTIDRLPTDPSKVITSKERAKLYWRAEKEAGPRPAKDEELDLDAWKAERSRLYAEFIEEEIGMRDLITRDHVMEELKDLTLWWKPFSPIEGDQYTKYRYSSPELYADALSVLLNNPAALKKKAPVFYDAFFNYLEKNPIYQQAYDEVTKDIRKGASGARSVERTYDSFHEGDETERREMEKKNSTPFEIRNTFGTMFLERFYRLQRLVNRAKKSGLKLNPMEMIDFARYTGSQIENYVKRVGQEVGKYLQDNNLTDKDLGVYLAYMRAINERSQLANPIVGDQASAKKALESFESTMGPVNMEILKTAKKRFRKIREELILDPLVRAQAHSPELIEQIVENEHYATFEVIEYLDRKHGSGTGVFMFPQFGTVKNITNPVSATLKTDVSLIWALNWNQAKMGTADFLQSHFPDSVRDAKKTWDGKKTVFKDTSEEGWGLLTFQRNGKTEGYYVDDSTADAFQRTESDDYNKALRLLRMTSVPARLWFTTIRPGFQLFNVFFRDPTRSIRNLPGLGRRPWKIYKNIFNSLKAIRSELVEGTSDKSLEEMRKRGLLISWANYAGMDAYDTETERLLAKYSGTEYWNSKINNPIKKIFSHILLLGNVGEIANKRAGFQYLIDNQETLGLADEQVDHMVRHWAGSPSFITGGKVTPVTNNLFLFSNAIFQGWRSDIEALRESPNAAAKAIVYGITPKAMMLAFSTGAVISILKSLGADDDDPVVEYAKWMEKMYARVSSYDMTNYTNVPLFEADDGKVCQLRVPQDEFARVIGGLFYKMFANEDFSSMTFAQDTLRYMGDQGPGLNPVISAALDVVNHLSGGRVYDSFRERPAVSEREHKAGGLPKHKAFGKWFWNNYGGSFLFKFKAGNPAETKHWLESLVQYPLMGDTIGRFFKITDYGLIEKAQKAKEKAESRRAREIIDIRNLVAREIEGADLSTQEKALLAKSSYADTYRELLKVRGGDQVQDLIDVGKTAAEKKDIIDSLFSDYRGDPAVEAAIGKFIGKQLYSITDPPVLKPAKDESRDKYIKRKARREKSISDAISLLDGFDLGLKEAIQLLKAEPSRFDRLSDKTKAERMKRLRRIFAQRPPK